VVRPVAPIQERFDAQYIPEPMSGCWLWIGKIGNTGYGTIARHIGDKKWKTVYAHRVSYELHRSQIPADFEIDHKCHNRACVNPDHLEPVTATENNARAFVNERLRLTRREWCRRAHRLTPENIYTSPRGQRMCRQCQRLRQWSARGLLAEPLEMLR
jgi:hypothetical protein